MTITAALNELSLNNPHTYKYVNAVLKIIYPDNCDKITEEKFKERLITITNTTFNDKYHMRTVLNIGKQHMKILYIKPDNNKYVDALTGFINYYISNAIGKKIVLDDGYKFINAPIRIIKKQHFDTEEGLKYLWNIHNDKNAGATFY